MDVQAVVDETVMAGLDDVIQASEVAFISMEIGGAQTDDQVAELSIAAVRELLLRGWMEAGGFIRLDSPQSGSRGRWEWVRWDVPSSEAAERIEREWRALGHRPDLGELFWLKNTELGNETARKLFAQRDEGEDNV